jgi:hypothetical protein
MCNLKFRSAIEPRNGSIPDPVQQVAKILFPVGFNAWAGASGQS